MITRDELAQRQSAFQRDANRRVLPMWVAVLLVTTFLPWGLGGYLRDLGGPRWANYALTALGFVGFVASAWCLGFMTKRLQRAHQLTCPHCGNGLNGPYGRAAMKTGRCVWCDTAVVVDPTGVSESDPADRRARDRRLVRLTVVGCALGLLIIWAVWIPLKLMDELHPRLAWPVVILYPLASFEWLAAVVVLPILYPRRTAACMFGASAAALAVALAALGLSGPDSFGHAGQP